MKLNKVPLYHWWTFQVSLDSELLNTHFTINFYEKERNKKRKKDKRKE